MNSKRVVLLPFILLLVILFAGGAQAFTTQWSTQFNGSTGDNPDLPDWSEFHIGSCSGQRHRLTGSGTIQMDADHGTSCFGAYYRDNGSFSGTFPADQDVRVMWRYEYGNLNWMGTQAGQVTGSGGSPQYYGVSGVDNNSVNYYHVESNGSWGHWDVNNPMWRSSAEDTWRGATFDFICDGKNMEWWVDGASVHQENNGPVLSPGDASRPYQFWMGNLLTGGGANRDWTRFYLDYVYIYAVERPVMVAPTPGSGGTQTVTWNAVANTQQPDGSTWGIEYQARVCSDANCATVIDTSAWGSGTTATFNNLPLNQTYYFQARARWVGTPPLTTCWGNTVVADMSGNPALSLSKTATTAAQPGETVQYDLTVQNTGNGPAAGVTVTDPIPQYITNPTNISNGGAVQGSNIVWNLGTINAGASVNLSWQGTIDAGIPASVNQIQNTATACDDANHCDNGSATTAVDRPGLAVSKSAPAQLWPGGSVSYQITVRNTGNTTLSGVTLSDPIPQYIINPTNISGGGTVQGTSVVWNIGSMTPGDSQTFTWEGTVDPNTPDTVSQITNLATATADGGLSAQGQADSALGMPELAVDKTAPLKAGPGESVTYNIVVRNTGSATAVDVTVTDPIPQYIINPTNISNGGAVQGSNIVWNLGDLNAGGNVYLSWEGTIDPNIPQTTLNIENVATACDAGNRCAEGRALTELFEADAYFNKDATPYGWPGSDVSYFITLRNTSMVTLTEVVVRDPLPAGIFYPRQISHGGQEVPSPFEGKIEIVWRLDDLAPGDEITLSWLGTIDPDLPDSEIAVRNVVYLSTGEGLNREAEGSTYILHQGVSLFKSATNEAGPGETVQYELTVENTTFATLYEVVVTDFVPQYILNPANISNGGTMPTAWEIRWELGTMAPGDRITLYWDGTVDPLVPESEAEIINKAEASDHTQHQAEAQARTELRAQDARLTKNATYSVEAGGQIDYAILLENTGDAALYNLEIRDPVPQYVINPFNISLGGQFEGNSDIVWRLDYLLPGDMAVFTWSGIVDPDIPPSQKQLDNQVSLIAGSGLARQAKAKSYIGPPELTLMKRASVEAGPGQTVAYTLTVENPGDSPLTGVEVYDDIPDYLINARNASGNGEVWARQVYWPVGTLGAHQSVTLTWAGDIDPLVPSTVTEITNQAEVTDDSGLSDKAEAITRLLRQRVYMYKGATYRVWPGGQIDYEVIIRNRGTAPLTELEIRDPLPDYVTDPFDISNDGVFEGNQELVWFVDELPAGETLTLSWSGRVDQAIPTEQSDIINKVTLKTAGSLAWQAEALSHVVRPALKLSKQATAQAGPGETIAYTMTLENQSLAAWGQGVILHDPLPAYVLNPTAISGSGNLGANEIVWNIGALGPGESRTFTWRGEIALDIPASVSQIINRATAEDAGALVYEAQAETIALKPALKLSKRGSAAAGAGERITYTLTVSNAGKTVLRAATLTDPVPPYILDPAGISGGGVLQNDNTITWTLGDLQPGETRALSWSGEVDPETPLSVRAIENRATAAAWPGVRTPAVFSTLLQQPAISLTKTAPAAVMPGQAIDYQMTVSNRGDGAARQLRLEDPLPDYVIPARIDQNGYEAPGRVVWDALGDLSPGQSLVVSWQGTLAEDLPGDVLTITNIAQLSAAGGVALEAQAESRVQLPGLVLSKAAISATHAGGEIPYILRLSNNGPGPARGVTVVDTVPQYVTVAPGSVTQYGTMSQGDALRWEIGWLNVGESVELAWTGQVDVDISPAVTQIVNRATATSLAGAPVSAEATTSLYDPAVALSFHCDAQSQAGESVPYRVTLSNQSQGTLRALQVSTPLSTTLSYITGSGTPQPAQTGDTLTWDIGTLAANASTELAFALRIDPGVSADQVTAALQALSADNPVAWSRCATDLFVPALSVTKSAPEEVTLNDIIEYAIEVENVGQVTAYNVVLSDTLPLAATLIPGSVSGGGAVSAETLVWQVGDLSPGQKASRSFQARALTPENPPAEAQLYDEQGNLLIYNSVTARADRAAPVSANVSTIGLRPVFSLAKAAPSEAGPGETIVYTLTARNNGPGLARQGRLEDQVPADLVILEDTIGDGGYYDAAAGKVVWPLGDLPAGESLTRGFSALVPLNVYPEGQELVNKASLLSPDGAPAYAQAKTVISGKFEVVALKEASPQTTPGGRIDYIIRVHNASPNLVANVVARDPLPDYTAYLDGSASIPPEYDAEARALVWNLGVMAAGEAREIHFSLQVAPDIPDWADQITNEAEIAFSGGSVLARAVTTLPGPADPAAAPTPLPPPTNTPRPAPPPTAVPPPATPPRAPVVPAPVVPPMATLTPTAVITATPLPGPELKKSASPTLISAGRVSTLTWTLEFVNPTPLEIAGVVIRDPLPEGLGYLRAGTTQGQVEITGNMSRTAVLASLGNIPAGGTAKVLIYTSVPSQTKAGTVFKNQASYSAQNIDSGLSNEAKATVQGLTILPVTGGLIDPRTPVGKVVWAGGIFSILFLGAAWRIMSSRKAIR